MLFLFDIDGTLIHCQGAGRRALNAALEPLLGRDSLDGIRLDGKTDPLILEEAFRARLQRSPSAAEAAQIYDAYEAGLQAEVAAEGAVQIIPGVIAALDHAAAWARADPARGSPRRGLLTLATGNWRRTARVKLHRVGLWDRFDTIAAGGFGCDALERGAMVRIARARGEAALGRALRRDEVLVLGDTPHDIRAAHAAGALAVGLTTGAYDAAALRSAGADEVFDELGSAMAALLRADRAA